MVHLLPTALRLPGAGDATSALNKYMPMRHDDDGKNKFVVSAIMVCWE